MNATIYFLPATHSNAFTKHDSYRKKLSQPGIFPMQLINDQLSWKLSLDYDFPSDKFLLYINGKAFLELPYQAEVIPTGP